MRELKFLLSLWRTNLQSAMEYRAAFIWQAVGMMLNNAVYFLIWVIFFDRFKQIRGWGLADMFLVFGIVASAFGLASLLFGNAFLLDEVIVQGRLDYYLSLPRPVLLHALASRSVPSGLGDFTYGIFSYLISGQFSWDGLGRFIFGVLVGTIIFISFMVLVQSLSFWLGSTTSVSGLMLNAIITFAIYPITLFDGTAKFLLLTLIPAALIGAVPAEFVRGFNWENLLQLSAGALILLGLSLAVFHRGLRRYESGSLIQTEV